MGNYKKKLVNFSYTIQFGYVKKTHCVILIFFSNGLIEFRIKYKNKKKFSKDYFYLTPIQFILKTLIKIAN